MQIKSFAKINLTLDISGKTPLSKDISSDQSTAGYHLVDTILHEIDLHDELTFETIEGKEIVIECDNANIPTDHTNTVYQAVKLLNKEMDNEMGIKITINKNIPLASGLGGGSSNAAATLKALNKLWKLNLSNEELQKIAAKIGMDTPFFINGGTARGTHYGEIITQLPRKKLPPYLIVLDSEKTSTKDAYASIKATASHSKEEFRNDFDSIINRPLQKKLLQLKANVVHICGSGPALYALFTSEQEKQSAYKELQGQVRFIWQNL